MKIDDQQMQALAATYREVRMQARRVLCRVGLRSRHYTLYKGDCQLTGGRQVIAGPPVRKDGQFTEDRYYLRRHKDPHPGGWMTKIGDINELEIPDWAWDEVNQRKW